MRTIELSNHPADALRLARQRRENAGPPGRNAGPAAVTDALARHELLVRRATSARDRARAQRQWLAWLRGALAVFRLRRLAPAPPRSGGPRDGEPIRRAGLAGERRVIADLAGVLGDDWVLVRGYCNQRGEIDHLLLGPPGLIAIGTMQVAATVTCEGDSWRFTTFDPDGEVAEHGPLGDLRGRSPSVQLNEPADVLEAFLAARGGKVSMLRVVLLTHPEAKLGRCVNATIHVTTSATELARQLDDMPPVIGSVQRARLEELLARDHRYHEQRPAHGDRPGSVTGRRSAAARTGRSARSASR